MFSFFKKPEPLPDFSALGVDMHSHLIPGIDDGVKTVDDAVAIIKTLHDLGYRKLITTPHVMSEYYPNTSETIREGLKQVRKALRKAKIRMHITAAAEYMLDEQFGKHIEEDDLLTLPGKRVLVEMGFFGAPPQLFDYLFQLQTAGYQPVLAHPERYTFYENKFHKYQDLKDQGCEFQLNLLSLTGHYGKSIRNTALHLLKEGMINFLGTDLHNAHHAKELAEALNDRHVIKAIREHEFANGELG